MLNSYIIGIISILMYAVAREFSTNEDPSSAHHLSILVITAFCWPLLAVMIFAFQLRKFIKYIRTK